MKLYEKEKTSNIRISDESFNISLSRKIDKDIVSLESYIRAFNSLTVIDNHIARENFSFLDKGNYILYNEYINSITRNLGLKYIPVLSQETVNTLPTVALNHHVALEGFIGDLWEKIKQIFIKIYNSIKEFFNKYFTKLGRVKNSLKNLLEVLSETDKDIEKVNLDSVPSNIASKLPYENTITSSVLVEVLNNTKLLVSSMSDIHQKADKFVSKDILDKNFIANINKLKENVKNINEQIEKNEKEKKPGKIFSEAKFGKDGEFNRQINETNKSLAKDAKNKIKEIKESENTVKSIVSKEINLDSFEDKSDEAQKEFEEFIKFLVSSLEKVKNKKLIKGKVILEIKVDKESGIDLEIEENKNTSNNITLDNRDTLIKIIKSTMSMIEEAEKLTQVYGKINDTVMQNINKVDKLILDIEKTSDNLLGQYKKLLNNKIKIKLNLAKTFFNNYNKVCKNIFEMAIDTADAVIDYSVLSLKHFG